MSRTLFNKVWANDEGFTLLELMVAIAIVSCAAALALPRMGSALMARQAATVERNIMATFSRAEAMVQDGSRSARIEWTQSCQLQLWSVPRSSRAVEPSGTPSVEQFDRAIVRVDRTRVSKRRREEGEKLVAAYRVDPSLRPSAQGFPALFPTTSHIRPSIILHLASGDERRIEWVPTAASATR